jgi:glutathione synthase/RimK-type ligase-like ATP-grasp enzyme/tetratricopeptide (TPR) repeat protein
MKNLTPDAENQRNRAYGLHKSGAVGDAIALYESILEANPGNADVAGLLALALFQTGRSADAFRLWTRTLAMECDAPTQLRNANNYLTAFLAPALANRHEDAASFDVPAWPQGKSPEIGETGMVLSLARGLSQIGRKPQVFALLQSFLPAVSDDAHMLGKTLRVLWDAGFGPWVDQYMSSNIPPEHLMDGQLLLLRAAAATTAKRMAEAADYVSRAVDALPVCLTAYAPGQKFLIGVLNRAQMWVEAPLTPEEFHFSENTPASLASRFADKYRFLSILPEAATVRGALAAQPRPDFFLNAEVLSTPETLSFISAFADSLDQVVLNHPAIAARTTRQRNAETLRGIANLVVPRILRFVNHADSAASIVRLIEDQVGFPVIIRDPFQQMGKMAGKLDTSLLLSQHLKSLPAIELYAIQYVHNPTAPGIYRKIRAAVIGGEMIISHVHFGEEWNVHRERDEAKIQSVNKNTNVVLFADEVLNNPAGALGKPALLALEAVKQKIPLDLYGIDFDLMPDGRVLFFEANAAMTISFYGLFGRQNVRGKMRDALDRLFGKARVQGKRGSS